MIPIDRLVEIWLEVRKPAPSDDDLSWWREACRNLSPDSDSGENDAPGSPS